MVRCLVMALAGVPIVFATGWTTQTDICVAVMFVGFIIAFGGHVGGTDDFNWGIGLGWFLMVAGLVGLGL